MNVAFYTDPSGRVTLNGAPLAPPEAAQLLGILTIAHDRALREGDRMAARGVRTLSLDLMEAMRETPPEPGIVPLRPVNITVRAIDPARWAAVPGDAA